MSSSSEETAESSSFLHRIDPMRSYSASKFKRPSALIILALVAFFCVIGFWQNSPLINDVVEKATVEEFGTNDSLESIQTTMFPGSEKHRNLLVTVNARRSECNTGKCIYRVHVTGPTLHAGYLLPDLTDSEGISAFYSLEFPIYEPGTYRLLVLL